MKLTSLSKSVRTIGLIGMLGTIVGMSMVPTAQAQPKPPTGSVCSAAVFDDPGYMYNTVTKEQEAAADKFYNDSGSGKKSDDMLAKITTFSVPLDSPLGYVVKTVNGKPITMPAEIAQAIQKAVNWTDPSPNNRRRMAELNQKYGQYATFGQNIMLILSPEQHKEQVKNTYEYLAYLASVLTPQQRQAQRDAAIATGQCGGLYKPEKIGSMTIDTGIRPDLDKRLREDKTGATFFK